MSVPGLYTAKIYTNNGPVVKVIGVKTETLRKDLIGYIVDVQKGEPDHDWYEVFSDHQIQNIVKFARGLDKSALIYNVAGGKVADTYAVLFYVQDTEYRVCVMKESEQKAALEYYIAQVIQGKKEVDWDRVGTSAQVDKIVEFAEGDDVQGVTYHLVYEPNE